MPTEMLLVEGFECAILRLVLRNQINRIMISLKDDGGADAQSLIDGG